jgi:putative ABC transport system ATP-binding protein
MSVVELRHVSKSHGEGAGEVHALRDVSLFFDAGALVASMGPSGSGKNTLLTIADSLEEPTGGEVLADGFDVSKMSRRWS